MKADSMLQRVSVFNMEAWSGVRGSRRVSPSRQRRQGSERGLDITRHHQGRVQSTAVIYR